MSSTEVAAGFFALALGVIAFMVGDARVQELQTLSGQIARGLSQDYQQQFLMFRIVRIGGAALGILGIAGMAVGAYNSSQNGEGESGSRSKPGAARGTKPERSTARNESSSAVVSETHRRNDIVQRDERRLVGAGSSRHFVINIPDTATLEYTAKVIDGPPINFVLIKEEHLNEYLQHGDSDRIEEGTAIGVTEANERVRLRPGEYAIILDNAGRVGPQNPEESAEVSITYSVTKH